MGREGGGGTFGDMGREGGGGTFGYGEVGGSGNCNSPTTVRFWGGRRDWGRYGEGGGIGVDMGREEGLGYGAVFVQM